MPEFFNSRSANPMRTRKSIYRGGGAVKGGRGMGIALRGGGRVGLKGGGKDKPCTGRKFGGASCPPGSKRYNLAKTFKKMAKKRKG